MRRTALTLAICLLVLVPVGAVAGAASTGGASDGTAADLAQAPAAAAAAQSQSADNPCVGRMTSQPDRTTLYSIQGARAGDKTSAMVVGVRPNGSVVGVHNDTAAGRWWSYDIDVLPNGNILQTTTYRRDTLVEEINATTGEHVSERRFPEVYDTHDVDLINGDELLMNDMSQDGEDRVLVYNLTREEVVWEYYFANHTDAFPRSGGGEFGGDWTHNNDVEKISEGTYMVSVRNFDQVVAINRSTKAIEWTLGEDDNHEFLNEQHNPDYLETDDGRATVIVADSLNDRVVEYTREDGEWNQTWVLRGDLVEPRDADRLPNGNTLVADRRSHRILEVTPEGEVVWEVYAPWQPYDVERLGTGDESSGPTMLDAGATGAVEVSGSADPSESEIEACYDYLTGYESSQLVPPDEPTGPVTDPGGTDGGTGDGSGDGDGSDGTDGGDGDGDDPDDSDGDDTLFGTTTSDGGSSGFGPTPLAPLLGAALVAALALGALARLRD